MKEIRKTVGVKKDSEGIFTLVKETEYIEEKFIQRYQNTVCLIYGISGCPRDLLDFLVEHMDEENYIFNNPKLKNDFKITISKSTDGNVRYADQTINQSFARLADRGLLLKKGRGIYVVNPKYFWKSSAKSRMEAIHLEIEFKKSGVVKTHVEKIYKKDVTDEEQGDNITGQ